MKHIATILLLVLVLCANAQQLSRIPVPLDSAERAYVSGNYQAALDGYLPAADSLESAALFYNIGNCYFKLNDVPHAILFFERAQVLDPGADDIRVNLDLAREQVVDRTGEPVSITLGTWWGKVRGGDPDQWTRWSLWSVALFFVAMGAYVLLASRGAKRIAFILSVLFLITSIATIGMAAVRHTEITAHDAAIIMVPMVQVRSEPREAGKEVFVLHEGTKVDVLQERNGWTEIRIGSGGVGWSAPGSLERI